MFQKIWEFAQSADCVAQTDDPQNACQSADSQIAQNIIIHYIHTYILYIYIMYNYNYISIYIIIYNYIFMYYIIIIIIYIHVLEWERYI